MIRIRLRRIGKKRHPHYRVVVADKPDRRDGKFIETLGSYDPHQDPPALIIDGDKVKDWISKGAQPSEAAEKLLVRAGIIEKRAPFPKVKLEAKRAEQAKAAEGRNAERAKAQAKADAEAAKAEAAAAKAAEAEAKAEVRAEAVAAVDAETEAAAEAAAEAESKAEADAVTAEKAQADAAAPAVEPVAEGVAPTDEPVAEVAEPEAAAEEEPAKE